MCLDLPRWEKGKGKEEIVCGNEHENGADGGRKKGHNASRISIISSKTSESSDVLREKRKWKEIQTYSSRSSGLAKEPCRRERRALFSDPSVHSSASFFSFLLHHTFICLCSDGRRKKKKKSKKKKKAEEIRDKPASEKVQPKPLSNPIFSPLPPSSDLSS